MIILRKSGTRLVYKAQYRRNEYRELFMSRKVAELELFLVNSCKYCISPNSYGQALSVFNGNVHQKVGRNILNNVNLVKLNSLISQYNSHDPITTIKEAQNGDVANEKRMLLSGARYLRTTERMCKLKDEYKANRINIMLNDLLDHVNSEDINFDVETLKYFISHVKNLFLPKRSFYAKKQHKSQIR